MNKFTFKLEPLYSYRRRLEEISRKDFAEAVKRLDAEEEKLDVLVASYRKSSAEVDRLKAEGGQPTELAMYYAYFAGLKNHIAGQKKIIAEVRRALEARRESLAEATRDVKVIENIKDKSYRSYLKRLEKLEQKATDALVTSRYKTGE